MIKLWDQKDELLSLHNKSSI